MHQAPAAMLEEGHRRLSVFALMGTLNSTSSVIVFVLLLLFLICLEIGFEHLDHWSRENDVHELVDKLKEELMMMGILSFTIFIYIEASGSAISPSSNVYNYYLAFELSHVILLFIAIAFIFQAAYLLNYAISQGRSYLKSKRISAGELVEQIADLQKESPYQYWAFHQIPWWFPANFPALRKRVEVKLVERLFLEYQMRKEDFRFAHYISKLFQVYIAELGNVSARSWLIVACLVVLNYARIVALDGAWNNSDICDYKIATTDSAHRRLGGSSIACAYYLYGYSLFICWMVPLFCSVVLVFGKYYKAKVLDIGLAMLGIHAVGADRQNYVEAMIELQKIEEIANKKADALRAERSQNAGPKAVHHNHHGHGHSSAKSGHDAHNATSVGKDIVLTIDGHGDFAELEAFKDNMKMRFEKEFDVQFAQRAENRCLPLVQDLMFPKSSGYGVKCPMQQVFWFDSPLTFFHHVELCLLFQSLYVSVWATQLIPLTANYPAWAVAFTIPMVLNFFVIKQLLHDAVILKAICEIHPEAIRETEEEEEREETCIELMREKLEEMYEIDKGERARRGDDPVLKHVWLERQFMKFDKDKSGEISRSEMQEFLSVALNIHFSAKEIKTLWLAVDEDLSGEVSQP